jgi:hypothetical protein
VRARERERGGSGRECTDDGQRWKFTLTPYLWLPNVNGTLKYGVPPGTGGAPEVGIGPNDYLVNLEFLLMVAGEARRGRWSMFTDLVYLDFSEEGSSVGEIDLPGFLPIIPVDAGTNSSLSGGVWTLAGGYNLIDGPAATLDVFGGVRYFNIDTTVNWSLSVAPGFPLTGSVSAREELWDAIVGVRGRVRLGDGHWSMPYSLDVGTGSSQLVSNAVAGISYGFGWGDVTLAYRHLYYDQANDKFIQDLRFSGPALGATFRF